MSEAAYQAKLIKKLKTIFPACFIMKNNPSENQGVPDILILVYDRWAALEIKKSSKAPKQANQDYYVEYFNNMSFAAIICPENEEEVLNDLQSSFGVSR